MWTTGRIYVRRKAQRHWQATATALAVLAILVAGGLAYTGLQGGPDARAPQVDAAVAPGSLTSAGPHPNPAGTQPAAVAPRSQRRPAAGPVASAMGRRAAGARLVRNHRLTLTTSARAQLNAGRVEPDVMAALTRVLTAHPLTVISFSGPRWALSRTFVVSRVDGRTVRAKDRHTLAVVRLLRALRASLRPASATVTQRGKTTVLVVAYR
jgi:hypothetical protein